MGRDNTVDSPPNLPKKQSERCQRRHNGKRYDRQGPQRPQNWLQADSRDVADDLLQAPSAAR